MFDVSSGQLRRYLTCLGVILLSRKISENDSFQPVWLLCYHTMTSSKSNYQHCTNSFRDKRPQKAIYKYNASLHGPWTFYRVKWVLLSFGYMPWYYILILCDAECHRSSLSPLSILNLTPRSADCYRSYIVLLEWGTHWVNSQPQACSSTSLVNGKNLLDTNIIVNRKQFIFQCLCVFEFFYSRYFHSLLHTHT